MPPDQIAAPAPCKAIAKLAATAYFILRVSTERVIRNSGTSHPIRHRPIKWPIIGLPEGERQASFENEERQGRVACNTNSQLSSCVHQIEWDGPCLTRRSRQNA